MTAAQKKKKWNCHYCGKKGQYGYECEKKKVDLRAGTTDNNIDSFNEVESGISQLNFKDFEDENDSAWGTGSMQLNFRHAEEEGYSDWEVGAMFMCTQTAGEPTQEDHALEHRLFDIFKYSDSSNKEMPSLYSGSNDNSTTKGVSRLLRREEYSISSSDDSEYYKSMDDGDAIAAPIDPIFPCRIFHYDLFPTFVSLSLLDTERTSRMVMSTEVDMLVDSGAILYSTMYSSGFLTRDLVSRMVRDSNARRGFSTLDIPNVFLWGPAATNIYSIDTQDLDDSTHPDYAPMYRSFIMYEDDTSYVQALITSHNEDLHHSMEAACRFGAVVNQCVFSSHNQVDHGDIEFVPDYGTDDNDATLYADFENSCNSEVNSDSIIPEVTLPENEEQEEDNYSCSAFVKFCGTDSHSEPDISLLILAAKQAAGKLNPWWAYLDTCYTFHQNVNDESVSNIKEVVRGIKPYSHGGISRTNKKSKYGRFLKYLETWFNEDGLANIISGVG